MDDTREREISNRTVRIDRTLCIGSGNCVNIAPEIYVIREDNIVDFKEAPLDIEQGRLEEAASLCPVDALIVEDEDGEQIVP
ncbi:MAG: ferredoxin [Bacteroidetes bacterium SW_11_64_17]|jgi:ferredoxin|nr:MAG: ferredoxin [Bacteroidetes bacterium SW_11_64_17]